MTRLRIGTRLTIWYLVILAVGFAVFGGASWVAIRMSVASAVDAELSDRLRGLEAFMRSQLAQQVEDIRDEFREHSVLGPGGDLVQVKDERGDWMYRSAILEQAAIPLEMTTPSAPVFADRLVAQQRLRFASARIEIDGKAYFVQVASPVSAFYEALNRFTGLLWLTVPVLMAVAGAGGYWISRRALRPVDSITAAAESISISNLTQRLEAPKSGDELQRLSETMNRMLERLQGSVQRMTQFTADASHELRTPVAVIRTTAELALKGKSDPEQYRADLRQILTESERTSRLIESLLILVRADSGSEQLPAEPTDLTECLRRSLAQVETTAGAQQVSVEAALPAGPLTVSGDALALERMFFNLLDNAVKYNKPGGTVQVTLGRENGRVSCAIADSGIGISEEDREHVFDRFWRADKARSRSTGGTGLGLAIAAWIAHHHHGSISVISTLGTGSRFIVELPALEIPLGKRH